MWCAPPYSSMPEAREIILRCMVHKLGDLQDDFFRDALEIFIVPRAIGTMPPIPLVMQRVYSLRHSGLSFTWNRLTDIKNNVGPFLYTVDSDLTSMPKFRRPSAIARSCSANIYQPGLTLTTYTSLEAIRYLVCQSFKSHQLGGNTRYHNRRKSV